MSDDYEIGYRKPPRSGQFKQGEVNNPNGRRGNHPAPKRRTAKDEMGEIFAAILREKQSVSVNGRKQVMTRAEVFLRKLMEDATSGKAAARQTLLTLMQRFPKLVEPELRPSGVVKFMVQGLQDVSLDEFLKVHPDTPARDLPVLVKYFTRAGGPGTPLARDPTKNIIEARPVPHR
jgi:hypothetical protein